MDSVNITPEPEDALEWFQREHSRWEHESDDKIWREVSRLVEHEREIASAHSRYGHPDDLVGNDREMAAKWWRVRMRTFLLIGMLARRDTVFCAFPWIQTRERTGR